MNWELKMENEEFHLILYETSWLSAFVAISLFEKTKPIYFVLSTAWWVLRKGIWKNKANIRMGGMSASIYMKGDYEEFHALKAAKNKANSKPICWGCGTCPSHPQSLRLWGCHPAPDGEEKGRFEKTKPIYSYWVLRDAYCEKELEKTKPICRRVNLC